MSQTPPSRRRGSAGTQNSLPEEPRKTMAERWQILRSALRNIPRVFALVWQAHKGATVTMAVVTLISGLLPIAQAWVGKLIID
ncbi:MAG: hypothetical protein EOM24_02670, partial [Chloroflexia bacterium]|nr:hypothetical protein [Chloroflexia bacterium]